MTKRVQRDDDGSTLILAVVVMMVLATLTIALQARTLSSLKYMRHAQDSEAALAAADAGLAKAVYRIENGQTDDWWEDSDDIQDPNYPLDPTKRVKVNPIYRFFAQRVGGTPPTEFIVSVRGKRGDSTKAIRALVTRDALFPYALFGYQGLTVDGSTDVGNFSFSVASVTDASGVGVRVGSNGMITCRGAMASNIRFDSFGGFSGCPSSQWTALEQKRPRIDIDPPPTPNRPCPSDGKSFGTTANMNFSLDVATKINTFLQGNLFGAAITAAQTAGLTSVALPVRVIDGTGGPYVCRQAVTLDGIVLTTGTTPVQIYVLKTASGNCNSLDISNALVNSVAAVGTQLAKARMFQIYKDGNCPLTVGSGNTADTLSYNGILYAPDTIMSVNGGKQFQGSIMLGSMKINGGPNIIIKWDDDLKTYYGQKWRVSRYAEVTNADLTFTGP